MMSNWFADHPRKVHILYVSPDWAKRRGERFDARRMAQSLAEARVDCVQFVIGPMVEACHEVGVKFMAYFSVGFDNYALGLHRDWIHVKPDGESWRMGPFYFACLRSPYGEFSLRQLDELMAAYPSSPAATCPESRVLTNRWHCSASVSKVSRSTCVRPPTPSDATGRRRS